MRYLYSYGDGNFKVEFVSRTAGNHGDHMYTPLIIITITSYPCLYFAELTLVCLENRGLIPYKLMSYRQISWSVEAVRLDALLIVSLWHLTGISSNMAARQFGKIQTGIARNR